MLLLLLTHIPALYTKHVTPATSCFATQNSLSPFLRAHTTNLHTMKFSTVAASLCVLGSASAFVFPVPVRSTAGVTRMAASIDEAAAQKTKAREALIGSSAMEELLKMVQQQEGEDEPQAPAPPAATPPPAESG